MVKATGQFGPFIKAEQNHVKSVMHKLHSGPILMNIKCEGQSDRLISSGPSIKAERIYHVESVMLKLHSGPIFMEIKCEGQSDRPIWTIYKSRANIRGICHALIAQWTHPNENAMVKTTGQFGPSRKHTDIILTALNPTFI